MSERETRQAQSRRATGRFGTSFWDAVEREIEALDPADFALFEGAGELDIHPRPAFERALLSHLSAFVRRRWSN